jgi:hypothetical protein
MQQPIVIPVPTPLGALGRLWALVREVHSQAALKTSAEKLRPRRGQREPRRSRTLTINRRSAQLQQAPDSAREPRP